MPFFPNANFGKWEFFTGPKSRIKQEPSVLTLSTTRLKKVRDCEHMTFFGISSKNFYAYF